MKKESKFKLNQVVLAALFAALTTVLTYYVKIPSVNGYMHIGDSMIYPCADTACRSFGRYRCCSFRRCGRLHNVHHSDLYYQGTFGSLLYAYGQEASLQEKHYRRFRCSRNHDGRLLYRRGYYPCTFLTGRIHGISFQRSVMGQRT